MRRIREAGRLTHLASKFAEESVRELEHPSAWQQGRTTPEARLSYLVNATKNLACESDRLVKLVARLHLGPYRP